MKKRTLLLMLIIARTLLCFPPAYAYHNKIARKLRATPRQPEVPMEKIKSGFLAIPKHQIEGLTY